MPRARFSHGVSDRSRPGIFALATLGGVVPHLLIIAAAFAVAGLGGPAARAEEITAAVERRLADSTEFLASDELEGRGVGTDGLDKAADYIAAQFAAAGLKTDLYEGQPFQRFTMVASTELGEGNKLSFTPAGDKPAPIELKLGKSFTPLSLGGSGQLDLPMVFAGYGITAKDEGYDDYAGIDVEGKAVIILRHEPQQNNPHSPFNGTKDSLYAPMWRKVSNAYEHGAAAVVLVTDENEIHKQVGRRQRQLQSALKDLTATTDEFDKKEHPSLKEIADYRRKLDEMIEAAANQNKKLALEFDPLLKFRVAGTGSESTGRMPVVNCRREEIDVLLHAALGTNLAQLERDIDKGPTPRSRELAGWRLTGEIHVDRREVEVKNVIGVLEGEGPHADETIVIGAHYDHLGRGGSGSFVPDGKEIHNGADDNASGTATLIEVARELASRAGKLPRRVVFIAFTGEERGCIGSARYCREPLYPLEKTVAMLNMDMVGRLKDEKLIIQGVDTAPEFGPVIERLTKESGFDVAQKSGGIGPSDHTSFYPHHIPVLHFFTGLHGDYHRPSDDFERINVAGMRRVAQMVVDTALALAEADKRPTYVEKEQPPERGEMGDRPYFGSIPDFGTDEPGYAISGATKDSPADKAGIKAGDVIIRFGESRIGNLEDFDGALRKYKAGDKVPVVVRREGKEVTLEAQLAPPR